MKFLFYFLVFPGFLFSSFSGLLSSWIDRKITARLQYRVGPRWYQNFIDIAKLIYKEVIIPENANSSFIIMPFLGLISSILVATILGVGILGYSFVGDVIVILYLLLLISVSYIFGAVASSNPIASLGASREMKLVLSYELPFIISLITIIIKTRSLQLADILKFQNYFKSNIFSFSGFFAFLVGFICIHAKLGLVPFDVSEAEQEIMGGILIEHSGFLLAINKLIKSILFYSLNLFLIVLFLGKDLSFIFLLFKYLIILVLFILVKNANPRLRIDQIIKFFWGPIFILAILSLLLTLFGY